MFVKYLSVCKLTKGFRMRREKYFIKKHFFLLSTDKWEIINLDINAEKLKQVCITRRIVQVQSLNSFKMHGKLILVSSYLGNGISILLKLLFKINFLS